MDWKENIHTVRNNTGVFFIPWFLSILLKQVGKLQHIRNKKIWSKPNSILKKSDGNSKSDWRVKWAGAVVSSSAPNDSETDFSVCEYQKFQKSVKSVQWEQRTRDNRYQSTNWDFSRHGRFYQHSGNGDGQFSHKEHYQAHEYQLRRKMCVYEHKPVTVLTGHTDHMTFEIKLRSGLMRMEGW